MGVSIDANRSVDEIFEDVVKAFATIGMAPSGISQPVFFIVGGPGSGKGTQCEKMVAKYGYCHLSSGDLLRAEVASGSEKGKALQETMTKGELVSLDTVLDLMKTNIEAHPEAKGFLIDGYPRTVDQGIEFEKKVGEGTAVVYLEADNETTIRQRLNVFSESTKPVVEHYGKANKLHQVNGLQGIDEVFAEVSAVFEKL